MTSRTTNRRQIKQVAATLEQAARIERLINAADHYTEADRVTAESLEAAELLSAFLAEEL
jgi:hypothetical protein